MDPKSDKELTQSSSPNGSSLHNHEKAGSIDHLPSGKALDQAYWYVQDSSTAQDAAPSTPAELKRLRWKVDLWIVPVMFLCYTMQFIDKVLLNVSRAFSTVAVLTLTRLQVRCGDGSE